MEEGTHIGGPLFFQLEKGPVRSSGVEERKQKVQSNCFDEKRYLVIGHEYNNHSAARKAPVSLQSIGFLMIPTSLVGEFLQRGKLTSVQGATL